MEADFNYFRRRAQEEREAAMKAAHPLARRAHREMANRYDELSQALIAHHLTLYADPVSAS